MSTYIPTKHRNTVVPVILAAGYSSRMGYPKALLPLGDGTFLTTILGKLRRLGFPAPIVVLGKDAPLIQPLLENEELLAVVNPDPSRGQLSSVQLGVARVEPHCLGCLIWPVDLPAVSENLVRDLLDLFLQSGAAIALPCYGERRGHPVVFHQQLFRELLEIPPGESAKSLVLRYRTQTVVLTAGESSTVEDIDTPEDYRKLTGLSLDAALARALKKQSPNEQETA